MGPLSSCDYWHGAMAMEALGGLDPKERSGLLAHLDGCPECREEARSLAAAAAALSYVDPASVVPTAAVPPSLTEGVLGALRRDVRQTRRRRAGAFAALGAVAAAAVLVVAVTTAAPPAAVQRTVALRGAPSVAASVTLTQRGWGTALTFREHGLPAGGVYTVSMLTASGSWWSTGTYRTVAGQPVVAEMSCAVPMREITGVRVTDAKGAAVLASHGVAGHWTHPTRPGGTRGA